MSFTSISIQNNAPSCSGVYGLSNSREWILIGEASDIRNALLKHLRAPDSMLVGKQPRGFSFEVSPAARRVNRRNELARELTPERRP